MASAISSPRIVFQKADAATQKVRPLSPDMAAIGNDLSLGLQDFAGSKATAFLEFAATIKDFRAPMSQATQI
jgi:hypothetical protein